MDHRLTKINDDYKASVTFAVKLLEQSGIAQPKSNVEWACNDIPHTGVLLSGAKY